MNYRKPIPQQVRREVLKRAEYVCEDCGEKTRLELHHLSYEVFIYKYPESIFGKETADDLVALCRSCHLQRHLDINGDFWRDPEEMENFWATYFEAAS